MSSSRVNNFSIRRLFILISILTLIFVAIQAITSFSNGLVLTHSPTFTRVLSRFVEQLVLFFFSIIILRSYLSKLTDPQSKEISRVWQTFFFLLAFIILFNVLIDPRGRFGSSLLPALTNSGNGNKYESYVRFPETPNLVVMGTSQTFSISPSHIKATLGYTAFNFGTGDATLDDHLVQARYIDSIWLYTFSNLWDLAP